MENTQTPTIGETFCIRRSKVVVIFISLAQLALAFCSLYYLQAWIFGSILTFFSLCGVVGAAKLRPGFIVAHFFGSFLLLLGSIYCLVSYSLRFFDTISSHQWMPFAIGLLIVFIQIAGLCHSRRLFGWARKYGPRCGRWRCNRQQQQQQPQQLEVVAEQHIPLQQPPQQPQSPQQQIYMPPYNPQQQMYGGYYLVPVMPQQQQQQQQQLQYPLLYPTETGPNQQPPLYANLYPNQQQH